MATGLGVFMVIGRWAGGAWVFACASAYVGVGYGICLHCGQLLRRIRGSQLRAGCALMTVKMCFSKETSIV